MSTITKEFTKEQLQQIEAAAKEVMWPVVWSEKKAREHFSEKITPKVVLKLARIALASLEAEAVCVIDQSNLDYLKSGSDADVWPASRAEMGDVLLYRSATPAPVSVPDFSALDRLAGEMLTHAMNCERRVAVAYTHCAHRLAEEVRDLRAAMLQGADGNSPVIPDCSCRTCRPVTISDMRFVVCPECGNKRCPHANDHRNACTGSNEPGQEGSAYPAAPQQEVKP